MKKGWMVKGILGLLAVMVLASLCIVVWQLNRLWIVMPEPPVVVEIPSKDLYEAIDMADMYQYRVEGNGITITKYTGTQTEVVIPREIGGMPVTAIGDQDTEYGEGVFEGNEIIRSVVIPEGVTSLGCFAFDDCLNLEEVVISSTVSRIGRYCFMDTPWLEGQEEEFVTVGDGVCIWYNGKPGDEWVKWVRYEGTGIYEGPPKRIVIPEGVKMVSNIIGYGLNEWRYIESVVFPDSLEVIGDAAFASTVISEDVIFPKGLKEIGTLAFSRSFLNTVELPDGLEYIGDGAFFRCYMEKLVIPASVKAIGYEAFAQCSVLTEVTFLSEDTWVDEDAFDLTPYAGWSPEMSRDSAEEAD